MNIIDADDALNTAVAKSGRQPFLFGSDFPHQVFDAAKCRHEIDELLAREALTQETRKPCSAATL